MSTELKTGSYQVYYLKGDSGPIDDRIFHTVQEANDALTILKEKVPSTLNENISIGIQTVERRLLTE